MTDLKNDVDVDLDAEPTIDEDKLMDTDVAKGFHVFTQLSDIMKRYPFDLRATHGGRIFADGTNLTKLRRKPIKGDSLQNHTFQAYRTIDNSNRGHAEVEISSEAFTPSMLIAAVAAKVAADGPTEYNRLAVLMLQGASALLQEGVARKKIVTDELNPSGDEALAKFYKLQQGLHARAFATSIITDLIHETIDTTDEPGSFSDTIGKVNAITDEEYGAGSREESRNDINLLFASIVGLAFSPALRNILEMADELKANIGEAAALELTDNEQQ